jgi:predicted metalloprotease with PDZ domain
VVASYPYYEDIAAKITSVKRNGSIGNPLLRKFDVLFDYQNSCIYLRPSSTYKEEFEYDMSGLELMADGDSFDRYFVSRVERGSPADEAGVQAGDELIGLNFNAVTKFTFEEVLKFLSSKNGRTIYIEFARDGKSFASVITLQKRI